MRSLTELDLSFNRIHALPEEIHQLSALTKLYLHANCIEVLPLHMNQMPSLTSLCISDNKLTSLPTFLLRSRKLTEVILHGNPWRFPANLLAAQWGNKRLDLRMQRLKSLPMEIFDMTPLTELFLSNNDLVGLPQEIENLTNLKHLDLFDNPQLRILPWQLGRMTNLTDIRLNSSNSLPAEVSNLSTPDLLAHCLSLRNGASPSYR
jgi:Leucine-rich repeat (LRR) protein